MQINADMTKRAVVHSPQLDWIASPLPGVDRRMLERDGGEVARATTIVRYAPESYFTPHIHELGEEFIVLEGVFTDETGDFGKGMYVRNPPGSRHKPSSTPGCIIFVKLRQMRPDDHTQLHIDTTDETKWLPGYQSGTRYLPLFKNQFEDVQILSWAPGTSIDELDYPGGAEFFVLAGRFTDDVDTYEVGSWLRLPAGGRHTPRTDQGCRLYVKSGHLFRPAQPS